MNARDSSGMTPLRLAAKEGHQDVSKNALLLRSNSMSIVLHANLQAVLELMEEKPQQPQPTEVSYNL